VIFPDDVPDPFGRTVEDFDYPYDDDDPPAGEAASREPDKDTEL
jgi:hypothetical protein